MGDERATERELLEACRDGNPGAAAELMRRFQPALGRVVSRLVGRASVTEEIVQETFLRTFERIDRIDPAQGARNWLFRVAVNLARTHRKRAARTELVGDLDESAPLLFAEGEELEARTLAVERQRRFERALRALTPPHREVLMLHHFEELPFPDIARILGVPAPILKMRAHRARARLAALLDGGEDR